jgi:hypothetical protein
MYWYASLWHCAQPGMEWKNTSWKRNMPRRRPFGPVMIDALRDLGLTDSVADIEVRFAGYGVNADTRRVDIDKRLHECVPKSNPERSAGSCVHRSFSSRDTKIKGRRRSEDREELLTLIHDSVEMN